MSNFVTGILVSHRFSPKKNNSNSGPSLCYIDECGRTDSRGAICGKQTLHFRPFYLLTLVLPSYVGADNISYTLLTPIESQHYFAGKYVERDYSF